MGVYGGFDGWNYCDGKIEGMGEGGGKGGERGGKGGGRGEMKGGGRWEGDRFFFFF